MKNANGKSVFSTDGAPAARSLRVLLANDLLGLLLI